MHCCRQVVASPKINGDGDDNIPATGVVDTERLPIGFPVLGHWRCDVERAVWSARHSDCEPRSQTVEGAEVWVDWIYGFGARWTRRGQDGGEVEIVILHELLQAHREVDVAIELQQRNCTLHHSGCLSLGLDCVRVSSASGRSP